MIIQTLFSWLYAASWLRKRVLCTNPNPQPLRNHLNAITQNQVMEIIINGEDYVNFDFSNALQIFKTITERKILSK
jgi:hypothetical protein